VNPGPPERWLVLFACQAQPLAACLEVLHGRLELEFHDVPTSPEEADALQRGLERFDRILISPRTRGFIPPEVAAQGNVVLVPQVVFQGYHPDLCYLTHSGPLAQGLLGPYHSAIAYAAWRAGYDLPGTLALYRADIYEALGFHDAWASSRDTMLATFREHGLELAEAFVRWSRSGIFMHSLNHPKIGVFMDIARAVLHSLGYQVRESGVVPPDFLVRGPVFPVYPEIGARLGVAGSYQFKPGGGYGLCDLEQYVEASRAVFAAAGDAEPNLPAFLPLLERAQRLFSGAGGLAPARAAAFTPLSAASVLVCDEEAIQQVRM
jgi:hypothetical protein